jgi:hypothetical protein
MFFGRFERLLNGWLWDCVWFCEEWEGEEGTSAE